MLKLAGCLCVLLASSGMAYSFVKGLRRELSQTEQLLDFLVVLEGEISYNRCPLPELLLQLSANMPQPYQELLLQSSRKMEDNREADVPALWRGVCEGLEGQFALQKEARQVLLRTGEVFAYVSLESSLQLLHISQKKLERIIGQKHTEFASQRKLYCCLCYMAGLAAVILLL